MLSPAKVKLAGQIIAAGILVFLALKSNGLQIRLVACVFRQMEYSDNNFLGCGELNTLNFIDGLDGLAAGISAIAAFTMMLVNLTLGQGNVALLTALLAGSAIGFCRIIIILPRYSWVIRVQCFWALCCLPLLYSAVKMRRPSHL